MTTSGETLRIGIIGLGRMGQNHLRVLSMLKSVSLAFIYDTDTETARRLGNDRGVRVADDLDAALEGVDAVVICTPTKTHAEYLDRASRVLRNIFIEKPLTDTLETSLKAKQVATERGLNIQVGFIERFNPAVQQMRTLLERSAEVVSVDFFRTNKISARITDVDVVTDLMIHDIDLALYLNGPVASVAAHGVVRNGMVEFASALLSHEDGRFSRIQASRITDKKMRSIQATCTDMFIDCNLLRKEISVSRQTELRQKEGEAYVITAIEEAIEVRPQEALVSELQAFVATCLGDTGAGVPGVAEGVEAMRICDVIQRAIGR